MSQFTGTSSFRSQFEFRTDTLDIILGGRSMIDLAGSLHVHTLDEALRFLKSYGYDVTDPIERAELHGNFHEALNFVRKTFLQPENPYGAKLEIPRKIVELDEIAQLLLMASMRSPGQTADAQGKVLAKWACAILKVMHTIAHIDKDLRSPYFLDIQMQILDRFYKVIHRDSDGRLYIGDKDGGFRLDLVAFETKPKKARDSVILKLLHKPENVAEDIFDRVGIRFITRTPFDALRVVKYLRDKMIIMPPNTKPSRSRNTLIEMEYFKGRMKELLEAFDAGTLTQEQFKEGIEAAVRHPQPGAENPHTSDYYRAIQFTVRQLIKLRNPLYDRLKQLKTEVKANPAHADLLKAIEKMDLAHIQREIRFFYPYEIQVLDQKSAEENERGRSAHSQYRRAQVQTALRRVLGDLADGAR